MKRMPFERPTTHYDERINEIDEQLCKLIKQRKEISNNNPGFPPLEDISNWAEKFELYEELLKSVFRSLWNEELFRPLVEPNGFRMHLPVLKSIEINNRLFSVTSIRQYINSSVVNFNIDWDNTNDLFNNQRQHSHFELFLGEKYNCRMESGCGSEGHFSYNFVVSPPLPDNISGFDLVFREHSHPFRDKTAGVEVVIHLK